jgi:hypothetical protein
MSFNDHILLAFQRVGARARLRSIDGSRPGSAQLPMAIDVAVDELGEFFDIQHKPNVWVSALDTRPSQRHLVLRAGNSWGIDNFLCGHDEFHWFVAALSNYPNISTVAAAKEALKPDRIARVEHRLRYSTSNRRNDVFLRQGEWFFMPFRHASIDPRRVVCGGELVRGAGSKPHRCDYLCEDGEREYECPRFPKLAFFESEYRHILRTRRKAKQWKWRQLPYHPVVYAKGWIRHTDHSPMYLDVWHRVEKNREADSLNMSRLVYRD